MTGLPAIPVCRKCGAPRAPGSRYALCTEHLKARRAAGNAQHGATRNLTRAERLKAAYDRLRVRALLTKRAS